MIEKRFSIKLGEKERKADELRNTSEAEKQFQGDREETIHKRLFRLH